MDTDHQCTHRSNRKFVNFRRVRRRNDAGHPPSNGGDGDSDDRAILILNSWYCDRSEPETRCGEE